MFFFLLFTLCTILIHAYIPLNIRDPHNILSTDAMRRMDGLVEQRAQFRRLKEYEKADSVLEEIHAALNNDMAIAIVDTPQSAGGGSTWKLEWRIPIPTSQTTLLSRAHAALGLAVSAAEQQVLADPRSLQELSDSVKTTLEEWKNVQTAITDRTISSQWMDPYHSQQLNAWVQVEHELSGRTAADCAWWWALAGCADERLYELLGEVCHFEILKWGHRDSCRIKDLLQIQYRLTAAGIQDPPASLTSALQKKHHTSTDFSTGAALLVWKFATRQKKQQEFLKTAARHWESLSPTNNSTMVKSHPTPTPTSWKDVLDNPTKPLILDIGCGMGLSLLGLARDNTDCNLLGIDLNSLTIGYAQGLAQRRYGKNVAFVRQSGQQALEDLQSYPGRIQQVLIQFPTPYRDTSGNAQLPTRDNFMVSRELLQQIYNLLDGELLLQSNCEDVAIYMKELAEEVGFVVVPDDTEDESDTNEPLEPTQRTRHWLLQYTGPRAVGPAWRSRYLPPHAQTETEIPAEKTKRPYTGYSCGRARVRRLLE